MKEGLAVVPEGLVAAGRDMYDVPDGLFAGRAVVPLPLLPPGSVLGEGLVVVPGRVTVPGRVVV